MRRAAVQLAGPVALLLGVALLGHFMTQARQLEFENALVKAAIVIALYVFVGNSGVVELSRMRVDSSADAQRKTTLALTSNICLVFPSTTRTPVARRVAGS